jgi:hypothetical protein
MSIQLPWRRPLIGGLRQCAMGRRIHLRPMVAYHHFRYHDCMKRLQIQFTSAQADRLRDQARQRGVSIAAVVREAVDAAFRDAALAPSQADR